MRNLIDIIDQITTCAPDLKASLEKPRRSAMYSAPENMGLFWHEVAGVLNSEAAEHPKRDEIAAIFSGPNTADQRRSPE